MRYFIWFFDHTNQRWHVSPAAEVYSAADAKTFGRGAKQSVADQQQLGYYDGMVPYVIASDGQTFSLLDTTTPN